MDGHLFVVDGDLTRLTCDAWLLPTDSAVHISTSFAHALDDAERAALPARFPVPSLVMPATPEPPEGRPWIWLGAIGRAWSPSSSTDLKRDFVAEVVTQFADAVDRRLPRPADDEAPLRLAVNVLGSGWGGMFDDKGTVHDALIDSAMGVVARGFDVVLVTRGAGAYSAAHRARRRWLDIHGVTSQQHWPVDRPGAAPVTAIATNLATTATADGLVLFLGAGASAGAGLPPWQHLLDQLWDRVEEDPDHAAARKALDVRDQAMLLARRLARAGDGAEVTESSLLADLRARLSRDCYSLAHGLLASLAVTESVTTNFDCLYESAVSASRRGAPAVLPYEPVRPGQPWLLKLHGSIDRDSVVLTRDEYLGANGTHGALFGIVQAMLMTKHMVFVGYSLSDEDFHQLVYEVRTALRLGASPGRKLGTVLTLFDDPLRTELWQDEFDVVSFAVEGTAVSVAARQQEIFLDLVAQQSSTLEHFLLDDTYVSMLTPDELAARDALRPILAQREVLGRTALGRDVLARIAPPDDARP